MVDSSNLSITRSQITIETSNTNPEVHLGNGINQWEEFESVADVRAAELERYYTEFFNEIHTAVGPEALLHRNVTHRSNASRHEVIFGFSNPGSPHEIHEVSRSMDHRNFREIFLLIQEWAGANEDIDAYHQVVRKEGGEYGIIQTKDRPYDILVKWTWIALISVFALAVLGLI